MAEERLSSNPWHTEVMDILRGRYEDWGFGEHNPAENIRFTHELVTWVTDMFPFFAEAASGEFSGELLLDNMKPLVSKVWRPRGRQEIIYSNELYTRVYKRAEHVEVEPQIVGWDEMMAEKGVTFEHIVSKIISEGRLISPGSTILDPAVAVSFYRGLKAGLEFMVEPDHIDVAVFGEARQTREFTHFALRHQENQTLLAQNAAHIAILGAERADYCLRTDDYRLVATDFDEHLFPGIDTPNER